MREILFRGKRIDNGEWVEGFYSGEEYNQFTNSIEYIPYIQLLGKCVRVEVIPETVGQYTGLTDKNGKKIFEGDILKGFDYPFCCDGEFNYFAEVIWFDNSPAFGIYVFKNPESNIRGISDGNTGYFEDFNSDEWEVIGNIHDNPELMGG